MTTTTHKTTCKRDNGPNPAQTLAFKESLRQKMKERRYAMPVDEYEQSSLAIEKNVLESPEFESSTRICCYLHKEATREPMTRAIVDAILADPAKELLVPITRVEDCHLDVSRLASIDDLRPSTFDVREPVNEDIVAMNEIDFIIIPCLAVDTNGHRIGYGKAYYDTLLAELPASIPVFALAFEFEIVPSIPTTPHDKPVTAIVTEKRIIRCSP